MFYCLFTLISALAERHRVALQSEAMSSETLMATELTSVAAATDSPPIPLEPPVMPSSPASYVLSQPSPLADPVPSAQLNGANILSLSTMMTQPLTLSNIAPDHISHACLSATLSSLMQPSFDLNIPYTPGGEHFLGAMDSCRFTSPSLWHWSH